MIDDKFHFVWLGEIPRIVQDNIDRVRQLYPSAEIVVWDSIPNNLYDEYFEVIHDLGQLCMKSDLIRLWAVNEYGGTYLDGDVYLLKRFDHIMPRSSMYFWNTMSNCGRIANCIFGDTAGGTNISSLVMESKRLIRENSRFGRTAFGPTLFRSLDKSGEILPCHYIAPYLRFDSCKRIIESDESQRAELLKGIRHRFCDGVEPFAMHFGGIPDQHMPGSSGRSSFVKRIPRCDSLLKRLPNSPVKGAEVGVFDGSMSSYLLSMRGDLELLMIDSWSSSTVGDSYYESMDKKSRLSQAEFDEAMIKAISRVKFSRTRATVIKQDSSVFAGLVQDNTLDFVFIDADHSYTAVLKDIELWSKKIKAGGILCGHDFKLSERNSWGVSRAVADWCSANNYSYDLDEGDTWFVQLS
jgi:hypothetical protein